MPVYNGERYLREAVESILAQTLADFEFIIVDDGSSDGTWPILSGYAGRDSRIVLVRNDRNVGIVGSLNTGLKLAQGQYIARMDADDISLPRRLAEQVAYLEAHPDVGLLGVGWWNLESTGKQRLSVPPGTDFMIRWFLLFGTILAHPGIMFRRSIIDQVGPYDGRARHVEDYELWCRMLQVTRAAILQEPLFVYRLDNAERIGVRHAEEQWQNSAEISAQQINRLWGAAPFDIERVREMIALVFLDRACAEWDRRAAADLTLVLSKFLDTAEGAPVSGSRLDGPIREPLAQFVGRLAWYHMLRAAQPEAWSIARVLMAALVKERFPVWRLLHGRRMVVALLLGRRLGPRLCLRGLPAPG